jgi:ATP-dependent Lhr-like helicase
MEKPGLLGFSKWGPYLPLNYQTGLLKEQYFDFTGAAEFLEEITPLMNKQG